MNIALNRLFRTNDRKIFKKIGKRVYIRNGVGYGFISDRFLYDNGYLEIGFGRITSNLGDWGGGFDRTTACPLVITIDKNRVIHKIDTNSFSNRESNRIHGIVLKLSNQLKVGGKLVIKDKELDHYIDSIFSVIPCKRHIGWDVFEHPHMMKHFMDNDRYDHLEDSKALRDGSSKS